MYLSQTKCNRFYESYWAAILHQNGSIANLRESRTVQLRASSRNVFWMTTAASARGSPLLSKNLMRCLELAPVNSINRGSKAFDNVIYFRFTKSNNNGSPTWVLAQTAFIFEGTFQTIPCSHPGRPERRYGCLVLSAQGSQTSPHTDRKLAFHCSRTCNLVRTRTATWSGSRIGRSWGPGTVRFGCKQRGSQLRKEGRRAARTKQLLTRGQPSPLVGLCNRA